MTDATENTKKPTVIEAMPNRRIFATVEEAKAYLVKSAEDYSDWGEGFAFAAAGVDPESGEFDPEVYTESMDVMVAKLRRQGTIGKDGKRGESSVKAIVVAPVPKMDLSSLGDDAFGAWARAILEKELNHVAVRALREAEDVSTVLDQIPTTLASYIESGRVGGGIMETFNELYKSINATLAKLPVWAKYRLIKQELKRAMESTGYAAEIYPALEDYKGDSLFVVGIKLGISAAKRKGLDPTIFERWLATRDEKAYDPAQPNEDDDELDIDSLTDSLLADDAKAEAKADADKPADDADEQQDGDKPEGE